MRLVRFLTAGVVGALVVVGGVTVEAQWWRWWRPAPAWQPPIGIPAPSFGITQVAGAATSTISGNIPTTISLTAGNVVEISTGTHVGDGASVTITGTCTAMAPCYVRGASRTNKPILSGVLVIVRDSAYVILENLAITAVTCGGAQMVGTDQYVVFRHMRFFNLPYGGGGGCNAVTMLPDTGDAMHDVVVWNSDFDRLGMNEATWSTADEDFHGVNPNTWGRNSTTSLYNVWVLDSRCARVAGNCVQVNAGTWTNAYQYLHHVYIGRNVAHSNRQAGFWSKQASDVIISQNRVYYGRYYPPGGVADGIGYQYSPDRLWIIFNRIEDTMFGIRQSDTSTALVPPASTYIIGNVIDRGYQDAAHTGLSGTGSGWGIALWHGNIYQWIIDNTVVDTYGGILTVFAAAGSNSFGNLIANMRAGTAPNPTANKHQEIIQSVTFGQGFSDYVAAFQSAYTPVFRHGQSSYYTGAAAFAAATTECDHCLDGTDPLFVDVSNRNYRLQAGSAAVNANTRHAVYDTFETLYGISIAKDFDGKARPSVAGDWDIGAFER